MDSILLGILVALAVWIFMKRRQGNSDNLFGGLFTGLRSRVQSKPTTKRREMPRIGTPGTITDDQINALKRNLFEPSKEWSFEEAALVRMETTRAKALQVYVHQTDHELYERLAYGIDRERDLYLPGEDRWVVSVASLTPDAYTTIGELVAATSWDCAAGIIKAASTACKCASSITLAYTILTT